MVKRNGDGKRNKEEEKEGMEWGGGRDGGKVEVGGDGGDGERHGGEKEKEMEESA